VQLANKNVIAVAFHSIQWHKIREFFKCVEGLQLLRLSAAYLNQSLTNWKRSIFYIRASFVDRLRESVSWGKVATRLRLKVCWCLSKSCKHKKLSRNSGHDDILRNCILLPAKKHTADLALIASRFSEALLQDSLTSKRWLSSKVEALTFTTTNF